MRVNSNLITHLRRKHSSVYENYLKNKKECVDELNDFENEIYESIKNMDDFLNIFNS
jgi:hypothetical protein